MLFRKIALVVLALLVATPAFADSITFGTSIGEFVIKSNRDLQEQVYMLDNKTLGKTFYPEVEAKRVLAGQDSEVFSIKVPTMGSACAEVVSIATISGGTIMFSSALNACGGVTDIFEEDGFVMVHALERDEETSVVYKVKGDWASENDGPLTSNYAFLE